jgi:hypothetical protein
MHKDDVMVPVQSMGEMCGRGALGARITVPVAGVPVDPGMLSTKESVSFGGWSRGKNPPRLVYVIKRFAAADDQDWFGNDWFWIHPLGGFGEG